MNSLLKRLLLVSLLAIPFSLFAQDDVKETKLQRKANQKKEQRINEARKSEVKSRKKHLRIQDKETRKRMKKNSKTGKRYISERRNFFRRIFR